MTAQLVAPTGAALDAAQLYLARKAHRARPAGKSDRAGRWYPCPETEAASCCAAIRSPSRHWPWSLYRHCLTLAHIATRAGADPRTVRRLASSLETYR